MTKTESTSGSVRAGRTFAAWVTAVAVAIVMTVVAMPARAWAVTTDANGNVVGELITAADDADWARFFDSTGAGKYGYGKQSSYPTSTVTLTEMTIAEAKAAGATFPECYFENDGWGDPIIDTANEGVIVNTTGHDVVIYDEPYWAMLDNGNSSHVSNIFETQWGSPTTESIARAAWVHATSVTNPDLYSRLSCSGQKSTVIFHANEILYTLPHDTFPTTRGTKDVTVLTSTNGVAPVHVDRYESGIVTFNGKHYLLDDATHVAVKNKWYTGPAGDKMYFGSDGAAAVGIATVDGVCRYFDIAGVLVTSKTKSSVVVDGVTYDIDANGVATRRATPLSGATVSLSATSFTWDGSSHYPVVTVTSGGTKLVQGTDYDLTMPADAKSCGEKTVTVTGKNGWSGTVTATYSVVGTDLARATVTCDAPSGGYTYDACDHTPTVTVKVGSQTLTAGTDYTCELPGDLASAGAKTATVTGCGGYYGTATTSWTVVPARLSAMTVSPSASSLPFTGSVQRPTVTVTTKAGKAVPSANYSVSWPDNCTSVGSHTATVTGTGSLSGSATVTWSIAARSISDCHIVQNGTSTFDVATKDGATLSRGSDYTTSLTAALRGLGLVVTGRGDWTGTLTAASVWADLNSVSMYFGSAGTFVGSVSRLWGDGADDTMQAIIDNGWCGKVATGGTVVLCTNGGYWDGLAASSLAGLTSSPIVMTATDHLTAQAASVISALAPSTIYVCGGTAAVSEATAADAASAAGKGTTVKRVKGDDAPGTAIAIYEEGRASWGTTAIVATSNGYWDALSASTYAYEMHAPIFLTKGDGSLSQQALADLSKFSKVYVCGGESVVPATTLAAIAARTSVERLSGASALDTSKAIAQMEVKAGMGSHGIAVATANGWRDALAGAAWAGMNDQITVLVSDSAKDKDHPENAYGATAATDILGQTSGKTAMIFGGSAAVSDTNMAALKTAIMGQ